MKVLFATYAEPTHYFHMVSLAWAIRNAGHEVRVASQPSLSDVVKESGMVFTPVGADHSWQDVVDDKLDVKDFEAWNARVCETMTDPYSVPWDQLHSLYREGTDNSATVFNEAMIDGLVRVIDTWQPDVVIWEMFTYSAAVAARVRGVPHIRLMWGTDVQARARQRFVELLEEQEETERTDPLGDWLRGLLQPYGYDFDEDILNGQATLDQAPPSLRLDLGLPRIDFKHIPYNGASEVPDWVYDPKPRRRVCITRGISLPAYGFDPLPLDMLSELGGIDADFVATYPPDTEGADSLPPNVSLVGFVPFQALLPTCDAIVHLGGAGTTSSTAYYGVPQLVLAKQWDTVVKGRIIQEKGYGRFLMPDEWTAERIRDEVQGLLDDESFAAGAARLREETAADPHPGDIVPEIERFVRSHTGSSVMTGAAPMERVEEVAT